MPIQYRCPSCDQLLSISTRKAGMEVPCPTCGELTLVPILDESPAESNQTQQLTGEEVSESKPSPDEPFDQQATLEQNEAEAPASVSDDEGGFKTRRPSAELGDLDLTSMVDVTFLLLIFFMVTASFSLQKTIELPPPKADQKGASQSLTLEDLQANTIFVRIDEKNLIFIDDVPSGDQTQLADVLTQARLTTLRTEVAIDAHPESLHETVVLVIDAATEAGMQKIRIVSRTGFGE